MGIGEVVSIRRRIAAAFSVVAAAAVMLAAAGAGLAATPPVPRFDGPTIRAPAPAPGLALRDQHGKLVRLSALRGHVVLVTFLYTHCPDVCPLTAENLNHALRALGPSRRRVAVLAVSVDPVGDSPTAVARFAREHRLLAQFHYLTGSARQLRTVWHVYNVESLAAAKDRVDHTLYTLLVDASGNARVIYDATASAATIAHDVRLLL